ncbi:MAG TPA: hypothetical protein PK865_00075 [Candidatus Saccharibacteria bacterium]|nr:hypothetical protein [Candidatus Saccharibacteria bacterium]
MSVKPHWTLYVLQQKAGKYYVGITDKTPQQQLKEHLSRPTMQWLQKYPAIKIVDTMDIGQLDKEEAQILENRAVRRYMQMKGIANVRGNNYVAQPTYMVWLKRLWDDMSLPALLIIALQLLVILVLLLRNFIKNL